MCQYCGCDEIEAIGLLMDEHVQIQNHCGEILRCLDRGDEAGALGEAAALERVMRVHNAVEERALYLSMTRFEEYADKAGTLYDEHDDVDAALADLLRRGGAGAAVDWAPLRAAIHVLYEHIIHEDNGLFPAAAIALGAEDWERCDRVRAEAEAAASA